MYHSWTRLCRTYNIESSVTSFWFHLYYFEFFETITAVTLVKFCGKHLWTYVRADAYVQIDLWNFMHIPVILHVLKLLLFASILVASPNASLTKVMIRFLKLVAVFYFLNLTYSSPENGLERGTSWLRNRSLNCRNAKRFTLSTFSKRWYWICFSHHCQTFLIWVQALIYKNSYSIQKSLRNDLFSLKKKYTLLFEHFILLRKKTGTFLYYFEQICIK